MRCRRYFLWWIFCIVCVNFCWFCKMVLTKYVCNCWLLTVCTCSRTFCL